MALTEGHIKHPSYAEAIMRLSKYPLYDKGFLCFLKPTWEKLTEEEGEKFCDKWQTVDGEPAGERM